MKINWDICKISIHAIVQIATKDHKHLFSKNDYFNPRYRADSDFLCPYPLSLGQFYFNPRYRADSDIVFINNRSIISISIHAIVQIATRIIYNRQY